MLVVAITLFIFAAFFGLIILTSILKNQPTPKPAVFIHGGIALIALVATVTYIVAGHADTLVLTGLGLLLLAALGGLTLLVVDLSNKPIPKLLALLHPLFAISGVIVLIIYALQQTSA